jgi:hypothetical protein
MKTLGNTNRLGPPYTVGNAPTANVAYTDLANIFTAAQAISLATAGTIQTFGCTENNASPEIVDFYRHRAGAAGQDGDDLAELQFNGLDDNGTPQKTKYARILAEIADASDTTEDGRLSLGTMRAGTTVDWVLESGTLRYQGLALPGTAGAINVVEVQVNGVKQSSGLIIRHGRTNYTTYNSTAATIANDDSIPLNTEGLEIATLAVTPRSASSVLRIKIGVCWTTNGGTCPLIAAVFVDSTANAIAAGSFWPEVNVTVSNNAMYEWEIAAGSTTARTYKLRVGPGTAGILYLNGDNTARQLGGLQQCFISVEEVLP